MLTRRTNLRLCLRFTVLQVKQRNIESELNDAKTELQEIKLRQQELEARNRLLEKVAELSKAHPKADSAESMDVSCVCETSMCRHFYTTVLLMQYVMLCFP